MVELEDTQVSCRRLEVEKDRLTRQHESNVMSYKWLENNYMDLLERLNRKSFQIKARVKEVGNLEAELVVVGVGCRRETRGSQHWSSSKLLQERSYMLGT